MPSSNDSQRRNSNSVLRRSWPRLHEITHPHTALSARFRASRRSVSPFHPDLFFLSPPRLISAVDSSLHRCAGASSIGLDDSRELLHPSLAPFNLHKSRVRRASGFLLTAFSNATPHTLLSASSTHPGVASEKVLASLSTNEHNRRESTSEPTKTKMCSIPHSTDGHRRPRPASPLLFWSLGSWITYHG